MDNQGIIKYKTRSTFFTSLFSISLVLFFLGICMIAALAGKLIVDTAKEELELKVLLSDEAPAKRVLEIRKEIETIRGIKSLRFLTKDQAGKEFIETTGDNFREALGNFNPFMSSFNIRLNKDYVNRDSLRRFQKLILEYPEVAEVDYPIDLISQVDENTHILAQIGLLIGVVVIIITYFLIYGTVKLSVHSKRLVIRTMQLIGATAGFIRKPFVKTGILQGFTGGIIASSLLLIGQLVLIHQFNFLEALFLNYEFLSVYLFLILIGTVLGWVSSRMAVNRFLHKRLDEIA
jgi:cell division transport system permease protein